LSAGFNLEGGKTNVLVAASYSDANMLLVQDRDFVQRGRLRSSPTIRRVYLAP